jgi:hypothetical protein
MEAPVDSDRATIPAMASCETNPAIAMAEERKRAVAGTQNLRVIDPPAGGESPGALRRRNVPVTPCPPCLPGVVCTGFAVRRLPHPIPRTVRQNIINVSGWTNQFERASMSPKYGRGNPALLRIPIRCFDGAVGGDSIPHGFPHNPRTRARFSACSATISICCWAGTPEPTFHPIRENNGICHRKPDGQQ